MSHFRLLQVFVMILGLLCATHNLFAQKEQHYQKLTELDSLTTIAGSSGNFEKAKEAAKEAASYAEKNLEAVDSIRLVLKMKYANTLILVGFYDNAEKELNPLGIIMKQKYLQSKIHADYLGLQGKNCFYTGKHELSENYYLEQIEMLKIIVKAKGIDYAEALNNLGVLYAELKRFEEAEPLYLLSKKIREEAFGAESATYGQSLNNLAIVYKNLKRFKEAEDLYLENLSIQKKLSERNYALALNNLAIYYSATGQEKKAVPLLLEAAEIRKRILGSEHPDYARIMHNLGSAYLFFKDHPAAEKCFLKAIEIREKLFQPQHPDLLESYASLANNYLHSGDTVKMWFYIQKSFENNGFYTSFPAKFDDAFREKLENADFQNILKAISSLNAVYEYYNLGMQNSPNDNALKREALNVCKAVLYLEDRYRLSFASENDKLRIASELMRWNKRAMALSFDISKESKELLNDAFFVAESNKSIVLLNTLRSMRAKSFGDLPDSIMLREQLLQKEISLVEKQLIETKDEANKTALLEKKNSLKTESKAFTKVLEEKYPKYYKLKYSTSNTDLSSIQQHLPQNALMLEYYIADSLLYVFSLSRTEIKIIKEEINPDLLKSQIKKLRSSLSDYNYIKNESKAACEDFKESAFWFYEKTLAKILEAHKKTDHLIIIPDAELGHLPFEVFLTEKGNGSDYAKMPYLINKYKVSYNYSAALWVENLKQKKKKNNSMILAAAALYSSNSDSLRTLKSRGDNLSKIRKQLQDLPMATVEVKALEKLFDGKFLIGSSATESGFKQNAHKYAVIHLAMHGLMNAQYPILSSLAFTENTDSIEDNFLQAYEISNMNLNAELVVLSACETGYGSFQQGEGVMSLARSFMYAGVPSLVVTLWQVNDASTAKIMQLFYKNLSAGMDKAAALRQAKLSYIKESKAQSDFMAHPAFWAAFVQLGDSSPIKIKEKNNYSTIIWIAVTLLVIIVFFTMILVRRKRQHTLG